MPNGNDTDEKEEAEQHSSQSRALIPYVPPQQQQQQVFQGLFNINQTYLGQLSSLLIRIRPIEVRSVERRLISTLYQRQIVLGPQIGQGGTNSVHRIQYDDGTFLEGMLIKDAGAKGGFSREYQALRSMESIGLRSVARGLTQVRGSNKQMLVMDFIAGCIDSKTIIGYKRTLKDYINPQRNHPAPNPAFAARITSLTLRELLYGWERMTVCKKSYGDFQFLIDSKGQVIYNDPTSVDNGQPNQGTQVIIQAMIDTWEFGNTAQVLGMSWGEFKRFKHNEYQHRVSAFAQAYRSNFSQPDFCILDWSFLENRSLRDYASLCFTGSVCKDLRGWHRVALPGGRFGYYTQELLTIVSGFQKALQNIRAIKAALL